MGSSAEIREYVLARGAALSRAAYLLTGDRYAAEDLVAPVEYSAVQGAGLYSEFLDNRRWTGYMADGYHSATTALATWQPSTKAYLAGIRWRVSQPEGLGPRWWRSLSGCV